MNRITELLDLEDSDVFISDVSIQGTTKFLTLETKLCAHHCPSCGFKMHSRGIKKRIIKHPILQDNYELILILKQRRWKCTNPECRYDISDTFNANFPRSVILNRVFGFTKLGFPYKINVFRTFLLKMCGFFAILIE